MFRRVPHGPVRWIKRPGPNATTRHAVRSMRKRCPPRSRHKIAHTCDCANKDRGSVRRSIPSQANLGFYSAFPVRWERISPSRTGAFAHARVSTTEQDSDNQSREAPAAGFEVNKKSRRKKSDAQQTLEQRLFFPRFRTISSRMILTISLSDRRMTSVGAATPMAKRREFSWLGKGMEINPAPLTT